jgi:hypothetical protein
MVCVGLRDGSAAVAAVEGMKNILRVRVSRLAGRIYRGLYPVCGIAAYDQWIMVGIGYLGIS